MIELTSDSIRTSSIPVQLVSKSLCYWLLANICRNVSALLVNSVEQLMCLLSYSLCPLKDSTTTRCLARWLICLPMEPVWRTVFTSCVYDCVLPFHMCDCIDHRSLLARLSEKAYCRTTHAAVTDPADLHTVKICIALGTREHTSSSPIHVLNWNSSPASSGEVVVVATSEAGAEKSPFFRLERAGRLPLEAPVREKVRE